MNEEDDKTEGSRKSLPTKTNKNKYSIVIFMILFDYTFVYIQLILYA